MATDYDLTSRESQAWFTWIKNPTQENRDAYNAALETCDEAKKARERLTFRSIQHRDFDR